MLKTVGRLLAEHRVQRQLSQRGLARYSGMSKSKISKIETGVYPGLSVEDYCYLIDDLDLELSIRVFRKDILMKSQTGAIEYHSDATGVAHCTGQGFTIVWQKGALCTQSDRNGATVEDVLMVILKRLQELETNGFTSQRQKLALDYLANARALLATSDQGEGYA